MPNIGFISLSGKCRKIITIHDLSYLRYKEFFSLKRRAWHRIINVKRILKEFDLVVAVSENTKQDILEFSGINEAKIKVIHNGISSGFKPIKDKEKLNRVKRKYRLPEKFILSLSTLEPRKNISGIIQAFDKCVREGSISKDYFLLIAGARGWKDRPIYNTWRAADSRKRIKFLGYIDSSDKAGLYNLANIFVYPSFYEGFGFPPLEAAACGTPVIISAASSLPELIGGRATIVNPYNYGEIASAIAEIAGKQPSEQTASDYNSSRVVNKFSWENAAIKYIELFSK